MADDPPYMPLYFGDILKLTLYWRGEERALLILLLAVQWWHGPLPFDLAKLASAIQYDEATFLALWNGRVHTLFDETAAGYVNADTEVRRFAVARMSIARRAAGQASGKARRAKTAGTLEQTDDSLLEQRSEHAARTKPRTNGRVYARTSIQSNPIQSKQTQEPQLSESPSAEGTISSPALPSGADPPPPASATARANGNDRSPSRRRRIPAHHPTEPLREWAREHTPTVNFDAELALIRDHEFRDPHSDWDAVVRNWLRRAAKQTKQTGEQHLTRYERHKRRLYGDA
jgi:uncharacterized protein YdaU (DUF1376 family)